MMRNVIIAGLVLLACAACADEYYYKLPATAATGSTGEVKRVSGFLEEIYLDTPAAGMTGTVLVYVSPPISTMSAITLVTRTVSNDVDVIVRPRQDGTTTAGAANTSDPPEKWYLDGERVYFAVTGQTTTGLVWEIYIKTSGK